MLPSTTLPTGEGGGGGGEGMNSRVECCFVTLGCLICLMSCSTVSFVFEKLSLENSHSILNKIINETDLRVHVIFID